MALRDYLQKPGQAAISAICAIEPRQPEGASPKIAAIATIAAPAPVPAGKRRRQATPAEAAEIRAHLGRLCGGFDHPDFPEALALALADPDAALDAMRNPSARMVAYLEGAQ